MTTFYCVPHHRSETEAEHIAAGGKPRICGPCSELMSKWLDARPSELLPRLSFTYGSGAEYDRSPAGLLDRSRARNKDFAALVREARAAVVESCRNGVHVEPIEEEVI